MTRDGMQEFAAAWIDAWNRRDLEAVLAHFAEDARFRSPKALVLTGRAELHGKPALRAYWQAALGRSPRDGEADDATADDGYVVLLGLRRHCVPPSLRRHHPDQVRRSAAWCRPLSPFGGLP